MDVVFKSLVGSHNYNLNNEKSDKDYKIFYYPTFEDLYYGRINSVSKKEKGNDVEYHDIRKLPQMLWKANVNFIEVLFSKEVDVQTSSGLYNDLFERREQIARMNLPYLYDACNGMIHAKMKDADRDMNYVDSMDGWKNQINKVSKSMYQVSRMHKFLRDYADGNFKSFAEAIDVENGEDRDYLLKIKSGQVNPFTLFKMYEELHNSNQNDELKKKYKEQAKDEKLYKEIEMLVQNYVYVNVIE